MPTFRATLEQLRQSGNLRHIPLPGSGRECIDLSSNDYLGLASRHGLQQEFMDLSENRLAPLTASASRLLAAGQDDFHALEELLSSLYGRSVLLFNSGYHANVGTVSAIASEETMILADKLVHASIIDGIVLSRADLPDSTTMTSHISSACLRNITRNMNVSLLLSNRYTAWMATNAISTH